MDKELEKKFNLALGRVKKNQNMEFLVFPGKTPPKNPDENQSMKEPPAVLYPEIDYVEFSKKYAEIAKNMKEIQLNI